MHSPWLDCPARVVARALLACVAVYCSDGRAAASQCETGPPMVPPEHVATATLDGNSTAREGPNRASPAAALPAFRIYISDARVGSAAMQALGRASERLAKPVCQGLLNEFTDNVGRPLADKLASLRMSAEVYLRRIVVVDGCQLRPCLGTRALAFTTPGSRVVYLCGTSFATTLQQSPTEAATTIIHELLHSLGLRENPPSSEAVSRRVRQLCW